MDYLWQRYQRPGAPWDLSSAIVVVPGSRAGRRLLERLVDHAQRRSARLIPPRIETIGRMPELLYEPKKPFADAITQQLAWAAALRATQQQLGPVLTRLPDAADDAAWLELGDLLRREHTELAADGLNFEHVAAEVERLAGQDELARWRALRRVQETYLAKLDALGLWDMQTARLVAIQYKEFQTDRDLILLGTVDLNRAFRDILDLVAERTTALIHAPLEWQERFDSHGCLIPERWARETIAVPDEQFQIVDSALDQADAAVRWIGELGGRFRADEITIGLPDETLAPQVLRQLQQCGLPARWGPGRPLVEAGPVRLCQAVVAYLDGQRFPAYAALVRHPDLVPWLASQGIAGDWLSPLDEFHQAHLPLKLRDLLQETSGENSGEAVPDGSVREEALPDRLSRATSTNATRKPGDDQVRELHDVISRWLQPLVGPPRPLAQWASAWRHLLLEVYGNREFSQDEPGDRVTLRACEQLLRRLDELANVPAELQPMMASGPALEIVLTQLAGATIPGEADEPAIELLGWLELPLDDAPALLVTSFNDGFVPKASNADPFLPNHLRTQLKLDDNARRYARDAYALASILATRPGTRLIVGRRSTEGDQLAPSRLLLACEPQKLAERTLRLFSEPEQEHRRAPLPGEFQPTLDHSTIDPPHPESLFKRLIDPEWLAHPELRVTDFSSYLNCPYRFFLRRIAKLRGLDDAAEELDGGAFGTLAHDCLREFGMSDLRDHSDADTLRKFLLAELERRVRAAYGSHPNPAVMVQVEQLRRRFERFAEIQAKRALEGWKVHAVEQPDRQQTVQWKIGKATIRITGRIDRIDVHADTGQFAVFDYKTGDTARAPRKTHQLKDEWIDFQLPLYRHLVRELGIESRVQLGYILLPKNVDGTGFEMADWSDGELETADAAVRNIAQRILNGEFWPYDQAKDAKYDDFARICLTGVLR
ncbi:MAG TPA: PD-(D/E)XK nuclease family protein [Pirellulaceae bacterium]|nr:PD-(D/E)XK nuclease family protein [Pirellulaceae bacterium]